MRTKIKFMTNDEQFRQVMKILKVGFKEQCTYENHCFIINDKGIVSTGWAGSTFQECEYEEIDADLFIRTNGSCEESLVDNTEDVYKDLCSSGLIKSALDKVIENSTIKALESENLLLKKKIENLHIALSKKVEKNKNQKEEITRLLKLNQQYKSGINRLLGYHMDDRMPLTSYIDAILKRIHGNKESIEILANKIVSNDNEFKQELKEKDTIIKYLESRLNEK
jgi:hypothetical protein